MNGWKMWYRDSKKLNQNLDEFRAEMFAKFKAVEHKHKGNSVTDDKVNWLAFDWKAIEAHFIDEFCEFFALEAEDRKALMKMIQQKKDFYIWANTPEDRGRAGVVAEPDREKEAVDVANMAFLMWWRETRK